MSATRRRFGRYPRRVALELTIGTDVHDTHTLNVGVGGLSCEYVGAAAYNTPVTLVLYLLGHELGIEIDGQVAWSKPGELGIAFEALRPIDVWMLLRYFDSPVDLTPLDAVAH